MRCEIKEFNDIESIENYLNNLFKNSKTSINSFQVIPYAVQENVVKYLVTVNIIEESDFKNIQISQEDNNDV